MQCARCARENPPDARFCNGCGQPLTLRCRACGHPNPVDSALCRACGEALEESAAMAREPAPRAYTPAYLAERVLTSRTALEGERKQVTVLFADLKGSLELIADRDPEEARRLLDPVLEAMMDAVHRYEGTVNQVMGDGIMALFGAPLAHEDHAVRACYAALAMQAAILRKNEETRRTHGAEAQIRVGLNSGDVVVRSIGGDLRMDYTAVGHTTFLASRMEQLAAPGSILLSGDTLRLAEGFIRVKPLGPIAVKGLARPVPVFELLSASAPRTRWHTRMARGLTRFVGRRGELEALAAALQRADAGRGQVVALVGDPGVGKSRLVWEFAHPRREHGWLILECGAVPYDKAVAYAPILDLLRAYFRIDGQDGAQEIREKVVDRIEALGDSRPSFTGPLLELLEVRTGDRAWQALDPPQRRQRTLEAIQGVLLGESRLQPVLLIVEDLQWIDAETQALLDSLAESLRGARVLLLVTYRPEYQHQWAGAPNYVALPIAPLPAPSAEELLDELLGADPSLPPLRRFLIDRTERNPFFLEESVRTLAEAGALAGARGAYRLVREVTTIQIPATVHAVLASRMDRLSAGRKRLLQTAAVVGRDVDLPLLRAITDEPDETLRRDLAHLQAAEFLFEKQLYPEPAYTFRHALTHELAYQSLLHARRRALHEQIVDAIEAIYADRLPEHVDRLAHHAFLGEVWDKALGYLRQAGTKAAARSANSEAVLCFARALEVLGHLPDGRERTEQTVDLHLLLANSLVPIAELGPISDHLREAERLAKALGDQPRLGRVSSFLSAYFWLVGDHMQAVEQGCRALDIAAGLDDLGLRVRTNLDLGQAYHVLGDYRRAVEVLGRNVEELQGDRLARRFGLVGLASVLSRAWLVWCLAELGDFAEAVPRGDEAIQIAETVNHPYSLLAAYFGVGGLHLRRGELTLAVSVLERALELCRVWDTQLRLWFLGVAPSLGHAYALSGRAAEAVPLLKQAMEQAAATKMMFAQSLRMAWLAHAYLLTGRVAEARRLAPEALELARRHHERGHEAWIHGIIGDIAAHGDPAGAAAERAYREAAEIAGELGMRPRLALGHLGLGRVCRRAGRAAEAGEHLATAVALLDAMQMPLWLEHATAELSALRG